MATVNLGRVGFVNKGDYVGASSYKLNDIVTANGAVYACVQPVPADSGIVISNESYWQKWVDNKTVTSISELLTTSSEVDTVFVKDYHSDTEGGGGTFVWDATKLKSEHNGGTIIDPTAVFPTVWSNQTQLNTWFDSANAGTGVWVRKYDGAVNVKWFGAVGDGIADDTVAIRKAFELFTNIEFTEGSTYLVSSSLNTLENTQLRGNGCSLTTTSDIEAIFLLNSLNSIENFNFVDTCTFGSNQAIDSRASACVMLKNVNGCIIKDCSFFRYFVGIRIVSTIAGASSSRHHISNCDFTNGFDASTSSYSSLMQFGIMMGSNVSPTNTNISDDWSGLYQDANDVSGINIVNNRFYGGQYGIANHRASNVSITGNYFTGMSRGVSSQQQSHSFSIVGNTFSNLISCCIHNAYGIHNATISGNSMRGVMTNDNTFIQAYYGCNDLTISNNTMDSEYSGELQFDGFRRTPGFGIRVGQKTTNVSITGNHITGVFTAIAVLSNIYSSILSNDPNYYQTGFKNISVVGNIIRGDYYDDYFIMGNAVSGVRFEHTGAWEDTSLGGLNSENLVITSNSCTNVKYPYYIGIATSTAANPVDINSFTVTSNTLSNCTAPILEFQGIRTFKQTYIDSDNSWLSRYEKYEDFIDGADNPTPDVRYGKSRVSFAGNVNPITVTNFINGIDGQTIIVRGGANVSIPYSSSTIRTAGGVTLNPGSNDFVMFIRTSGIWFQVT